MRCAKTMLRSALTIAISLPLLTGCVPELLALGRRPTTVQVVACPELPPPPDAAVDALEAAGRSNEAAAAWVIDLSQHYDALDRCHRPAS